MRSGSVSAQVFLGLGMGAANAMGYLFVVILSRALGPDAFGAFSALNNVGIVLSIPAGAFQVLVASRVARRGTNSFDFRLPLTAGLAICLLTIALTPLLSGITRGTGMLAPVLVGLGFVPMIINGALMGLLLGIGRIRALAAVYVTGGVTRMAAAVLTGELGLHVPGAFALVVTATTLTTLLSWFLGRDHVKFYWSAPSTSPLALLRAMWRSNSSIGVLVALTSVDVVLARYFLTGIESGQYALVSTIGRAPVWATQFVALALVPALAKTGSRASVVRATAVVLGLCLLGLLVGGAAPEFWVTLLGGHEYRSGAGLLVPYLILGTLLSLAQVLVVAEMAQRGHVLATVTWIAVSLQITLSTIWMHENAFQLVLSAAISAALVVAVGILRLLRQRPAPDFRDRAVTPKERASETPA